MAKAKKSKKKLAPEPIIVTPSSGNVFADGGYPNPEEANAKSDLGFLIRSSIKQKKLTQAQAAKIMGIDQPKISKIMRGILSDFSLDSLIKYLVFLGYDIEINATRRKSPSIHVGKTGEFNSTLAIGK